MRYALRQLRKQPGLTAVAIITLALGISANATLLGILNVLFFEPLRVKDPGQLVMVLQKSSAWKYPHGHSWLDYQDYRKRVPEFEDALAGFLQPAHLSSAGQTPERTWIESVSGNYFSVLGVPPALGRTFVTGEGEHPGADPIVVLSHGFWERRFGGDPAIVGKVIQINGKPLTVVGVMPRGYPGAQWGLAVSAWVPATMQGEIVEGGRSLLDSRRATAFRVMARLKQGVSLARARASVEVIAAQLATEYPMDHRESSVLVVPERRCRPEPTFSEIMPAAATMFLAIAFFVLLIACANVANLMFARAITRQREMGIRSALGATRSQLVRQLLLESVLIALLAGLLGSVLSYFLGSLLNHLAPTGDIPIQPTEGWSARVFVATLVLSVIAGIIAGIITGVVPALNATRTDVQSHLKAGSLTLASARHPFRTALVVSQIGLAFAVLVCGALFVGSLRRTGNLDLGFRTRGLLMASVDLGLQGYSDHKARSFIDELLVKARSLPGVKAATAARSVAFDYNIRLAEIGAEGSIVEGGEPGKDGYITAAWNIVDPSFLATLGIPLVSGRDFNPFDTADSLKVVIVNQTLAKQFWPGQDPLSKRLRVERGGDFLTVVGVVRDGKYVFVGEEPRPYFYVPLAQRYESPLTLYLRANDDPMPLAASLRRVIADLDPNLPIYNLRTMDEHLRQSAMALMPLRLAATMAGTQGAVGLFLAVLGLYGVLAYSVRRRTREIGIRMALGAPPSRMVLMILREGWRLTLAGLLAGAFLAVLLATGLSRILPSLGGLQVPIFLGVSAVLTTVALLACYIPARRAALADPMEALRSE